MSHYLNGDETSLIARCTDKMANTCPGTDNTLRYYQENAANFAERTAALSMTDIQERFAGKLCSGAFILDFGCGSGRDSAWFLEHGFRVDALDGSEKLCQIAAKRTGLNVRHMLFQEFAAPEMYDGIWACASILHLSRHELKLVLRSLYNALNPHGLIYASFKYGEFEGERNGRYFTDMTPDSFYALMLETGPDLFDTEDQWITQDVRPDRQEKWLNLILRRMLD